MRYWRWLLTPTIARRKALSDEPGVDNIVCFSTTLALALALYEVGL